MTLHLFWKHPIQLFFLLLLPGLLLTSSCKSTKAAQTKEAPLPQALLWRIEGKESKEPSYLFGTIHLIPKSDFFLPVGFDEAFDHCDQVVFEIDMDDMSDMNALMGMLGNIVMKDNMTLKKLLTPEEYKEVSDYFEGMGLPMFLLNKVKPMFLSMLAEVNMDPSTMGNDDIVSYETDIYEKANERKKEVGGLETMAYQMSLFDSIPYTDQAKMLVDAVRSTNQGSDSLDETLALYKTQNIEGMVDLAEDKDQSGIGDYEDLLLNNRNRNWIPRIGEWMRKGTTLFAVGAGHLGGKNGVIRLLQKAGYKVTPVSTYKTISPRKI